jgi:HlyD family secretion protein
MFTTIKKLTGKVLEHKFISLVIFAVLAYGAYYGYGRIRGGSAANSYVLGLVKRGDVIASISGSGQVSSSNQIGLAPKASGDVVLVGAQSGDRVKKGTLLLKIDTQNAEKNLRDAKAGLESAKLSMKKLVEPADALTILQAENALATANETKQETSDSLKKDYDDGFNTTSNAFLDLPPIISGLNDLLFGSAKGLGGGAQWNIDYYADNAGKYDDKASQYRDDAYSNYQTARQKYDKNFTDYKTTGRFASEEDIEALIQETYDTTKAIADAVKSSSNLIQFYKDQLIERGLAPAALADTHLSYLSGYTSKTNTHLSNLFNALQAIQNDKNSLVSIERTIAEKTESLAKLKAGPNALDIQSQQLTIEQKQNALLDAQENLKNYYIYAPFDGTVAVIDAKVGDTASSATTITFIAEQKLAEISLNEVDVAKLKIGQKATVTFDALPDLGISGEVAQIDTIGTVTQGVVTYNAKIAFDTQDDRVKPGMSVAVSIVTDTKLNTLTVANSAVKNEGENYYVEVPVGLTDQEKNSGTASSGTTLANTPVRQDIKIGLSNDSITEVADGLKEGDTVILRTINSAATATTANNSGLRIPGFGGGR